MWPGLVYGSYRSNPFSASIELGFVKVIHFYSHAMHVRRSETNLRVRFIAFDVPSWEARHEALETRYALLLYHISSQQPALLSLLFTFFVSPPESNFLIVTI